MKDIILTAKRVKKELIVLLVCFIIAFVINVAAIIIYKTPWYEMFSQIGYVAVIAIVLYLLLAIIRGLISLIRKSRKH